MRRPFFAFAPLALLACSLHAQAAVRPAPAAAASLVFLDAARAGPVAPRGETIVLVVERIPTAPGVLPEAWAMLDSLQKRRPVVEHSNAFYTRLTIHRWASYTMVPLFVAQYVAGEQLISRRDRGEDAGSLSGLHGTLAGAVAGLFVVNTVTGAWNWWDERREPEGRTKRTVHSLLLLLADAGFVATGATANGIEDEDEGEDEGGGSASTHRNLAIGSMAVATVGAAMMWFWKD